MKEFDARKTEELMKDLETLWSLIARYQNHENDYFLDMVLTPKRVRLEQEIIDRKISNQSHTDKLTESIMKAAENNDYEAFIKSVQKGADIMHTNFSVLDYFIRHNNFKPFDYLFEKYPDKKEELWAMISEKLLRLTEHWQEKISYLQQCASTHGFIINYQSIFKYNLFFQNAECMSYLLVHCKDYEDMLEAEEKSGDSEKVAWIRAIMNRKKNYELLSETLPIKAHETDKKVKL